MDLHPLLERQIRRARASDGGVDTEALFHAVSETYRQADRDRGLNDRAMHLLRGELEALATTLKDDVEAQFKAVMDIVGEALIVIDERGIVVSFNRAAERVFGWAAGEVIGNNITMLMTEEHAAHHDATLANYIRTGKSRIMGVGREAEARRKNGEVFPIDLNVGEFLARGPGRRFIGIIRDISQRKKTEQELRESESRFRDLAGSASDWFWETDPEHRFTFLSERIREVLGIDPGEAIGRTRFDTGLGVSAPELVERHRADIEAHRPFRDFVYTLAIPGHDVHPVVRISGIPMFDADGTFTGYRGTGSNITREAAAEARAQLASRQLLQAIESVTDGFALYDPEDRLVLCNAQYRRLFGGIDDVIKPGATFAAILGAAIDRGVYQIEDAERHGFLAARLEEHRQPTGQAMLHQLAKDRWIQSRDYRSTDGSTVVIRTDVTGLMHREHELERLRHRYEMILQSAGDGIIGLDPDARISFVNTAAQRMLGWRQDDMVAVREHCLFHDRRADGSPYPVEDCAILAAIRAGEEVHASDEVFWHRDGTGFPVEYVIAPIREDGAVSGAVLIFRNITVRRQLEQALAEHQRDLEHEVEERTRTLRTEIAERKRTELALAESQSLLRSITASLFDGVMVVDAHGHVVFANAAAGRLLDCAEPMTGQELDAFFTLWTGQRVAFADSPFRRVAETGETIHDDDAAFRTAAGVPIPVGYACSPLVERGKRRGAIISFRNIGVLKQAQQEAVQASRLASVGQLAAGIAHEINTPIQYIGDNLNFLGESFSGIKAVCEASVALADAAGAGGSEAAVAERLRAACDTAELDYLLDEIPAAISQSLEGVAQVSAIVRSMKEFSHPGTKTKVATDINRAIESTLTVSRNEWKHLAEVDLDLDPDLPPVLCLPAAMNQVFLNLIINAVHAIAELDGARPGRIAIATRRDGAWAEIRIADNGPGIPAEIRDKIFDPFFTTKEVGKGTGQGLMICRDVVVTKHGGRITLEGGRGAGATFVIQLPLGTERDAAP